jgi:NAD+ kinase
MIGVIAHSEKPAAATVLRELLGKFRGDDIPHVLERHTAALIGESSTLDEADVAGACDLLVVMGGDGTILRVAQKLPDRIPPVFGINIGTLGFLTCLGSNEIPRAVESIVAKDYRISHRSLIEAVLRKDSGETETLFALNDVVVSRGERSQLVQIRVAIDGIPLTNYNADGLVVATPTGSTAYSLSAGGPILMPDSGSFVITPICPHVLTNRSVVISDQSVVEVGVAKEGQTVFVSADSQRWSAMTLGDSLSLKKSSRSLPLAMLPERPFSEVLRQKLKWSGTNI